MPIATAQKTISKIVVINPSTIAKISGANLFRTVNDEDNIARIKSLMLSPQWDWSKPLDIVEVENPPEGIHQYHLVDGSHRFSAFCQILREQPKFGYELKGHVFYTLPSLTSFHDVKLAIYRLVGNSVKQVNVHKSFTSADYFNQLCHLCDSAAELVYQGNDRQPITSTVKVMDREELLRWFFNTYKLDSKHKKSAFATAVNMLMYVRAVKHLDLQVQGKLTFIDSHAAGFVPNDVISVVKIDEKNMIVHLVSTIKNLSVKMNSDSLMRYLRRATSEEIADYDAALKEKQEADRNLSEAEEEADTQESSGILEGATVDADSQTASDVTECLVEIFQLAEFNKDSVLEIFDKYFPVQLEMATAMIEVENGAYTNNDNE